MKSCRRCLPWALLGLLGLALLAVPTPAAPTPARSAQILLPLGRSAYQTNERIDLSVVRSGPENLASGELALTLTGSDGSRLAFTFPVKAVPVQDKQARATEHFHVNGYLLRPGHYTVEVAVDGVTTSTTLDVFNHIRKSSFRLINWGRAEGKEQLVQGADSLGYNLFYGSPDPKTDNTNLLRAGVDFMSNCTMSGAHQMDIRSECDWSDPYVTRGGTVRVARRAFADRTKGHVPGVHFYDEPGLTWLKDPETGENTPHAIPSQVRAYRAAFGHDPISYRKVNPNNPQDVARWNHWARWKLAFMDSAWKEAQFGVSQVRPDYLSVTQSQYGWSAFTDGYYFTVTRSLPVNSGHGGYDDYGPSYFNPSFTLEMARARDHDKACWYLPCWYGNTPSDRFRLEQYLSFETNIQGMMSPPDMEPARNATGRQGIVESNHLMARLGPIFTTMPVTRPPVALLYSLSQAIHTQTKDMTANYAHAIPQGANLPLTYLAGKVLQQQFLPIVEEDILDGTLANDHKAVVLTSLDYLDPRVIAALENFIQGGGLVLMTGDCTVKIKGATKLNVVPRMPDQEIIDRLNKAGKYPETAPYTTGTKYFEAAAPIARAIKAELDKAGIKPIFESSVPTIAATRQTAGDIEYLFAVNATHDGSKEKNNPAAVAATITLEDGKRPVYDAVVGGPVGFETKDGHLTGSFRFGPGQMRVFARTVRPIGGVRVATPVVQRDLTRAKEPIRIDVAATLVDDLGGVLSGSAPLHVRVIDPFGVVRHELLRATKLGQFAETLPLAANDPAGAWQVRVTELLSNKEATVYFTYKPPVKAASLAGGAYRALFFGNDRENVFRFARQNHDVTIVSGSSPYNNAAAERLQEVLKPWGIRCKIVDAKSVAKPRALTEEEAKTWVGLGFGRAKVGEGNPVEMTGFAVRGPVILLGTPEDNPLIKYLVQNHFLPYQPVAGTFPGPGRGMVAWQREGVGHGQESVTLIADDKEGMSEAVGSFYEAVAGLDPLTPWTLPRTNRITPAKSAPDHKPEATVAWTVDLPDRVDAIQVSKTGLTVLTHDGSLSLVTPEGKVTSSKPLSAAETTRVSKEMTPPADPATAKVSKEQARPDRVLKLVASGSDGVAVAYWGGTVRVVDANGRVKTEQQLRQDVTALAWLGNKLVAGLANGQVLVLQPR